MSAFLARVAGKLTKHWVRGLIATLITLIVLGFLSATASKPTADFSAPGSDSDRAVAVLQKSFPEFANASRGASADVVFHSKGSTLKDPKVSSTIKATIKRLRGMEGVSFVSDPLGRGGAISKDGKTAVATVSYKTALNDLSKEDAVRLEKGLSPARSDALQVESRGQIVDLNAEQSVPIGELAGVMLAIILLTVLFRSLSAMFATIIGAFIGVAVGQMLLALLAKPLGLPDFASQVAVMLGLGAGIDYALLIVGRYREQIQAGDTPEQASAKSAATSGTSVVAAGLIVMIAIAGLLTIGIPLIGRMGIGVAIAIAGVVVSALTVLPVMLGALQRWLKPRSDASTRPSAAFERWGQRIVKRPWLALIAGGLALVVLALPVLDMRLGQPDDGNKSADQTQRKAYDLATAAFGAGTNGPLLLAIKTPGGAKSAQPTLAALSSAIKNTEGVRSASPPAPSKDGQAAIINVIPTTSPQAAETSKLVTRLRETVIPKALANSDVKVYVGGLTAANEDFSAKVSSRLPVFIAVVIGLSILLLIAAFRSIWVPLVSAAFNLLSIGAAYGVVVLVFQKNVGSGLLGIGESVPIISFIPVMMFAILFGLSMDYNVFLLSRMREAYFDGAKPSESVVLGLSRIGRVILVAGLIMGVVFFGFATIDDVITKMFGVGLGVAILIDVVLVRMVISPAVMAILGDRAWGLPAWLDRVLPNIHLEGDEDDHPHLATTKPQPEAAE